MDIQSKYSIELQLDKVITKEEIHSMLEADLPDKLKGFGKGLVLIGNKGYSYAMDVIVKDSQERDFIELHANYGYDYNSFLLQTIFSCVKRGYAIKDIRFFI